MVGDVDASLLRVCDELGIHLTCEEWLLPAYGSLVCIISIHWVAPGGV